MVFSDLFNRLQAAIEVVKPPIVPDPSAEGVLDGAINLALIILASICFIVIILQGIKYSLSAANPEALSKARNGIIYALVGLTIAVSAWSLLNFTLDFVLTDDVFKEPQDISTVLQVLKNVAGFMIFIGAIISTIMIIIGAIKYITSGGSSEQASSARNTIIYALIGMVITISAGPILHFILSRLG